MQKSSSELSDQEMIQHLNTMADWTSEKPWRQIAERLEEFVNKEKKNG
jgi:ribosomal protein L18E